jgi:2-hydroxy-6-oxonona-2,4-dienedioate hydrolase
MLVGICPWHDSRCTVTRVPTRWAAESLWTKVSGLRMYARVWERADGTTSGPPIVLVHGIAVSSRYMVPTGERLSPTHRVYAPDLPGFGRSEKPPAALTIEQLADALGAWLDANEIERPLLVGNSNGCQVIADLAARRAGCCCGLVLNSPTVDIAHRAIRPELLRLFADAPRERLGLIAINAGDYIRAGFRRSIATLHYAIADAIEDKLPHIHEPMLIVRGSRDPIVSDAWVRFLAATRGEIGLVTIPGAPHAANFSAADALVVVIREFLARAAKGSVQEQSFVVRSRPP